MMPRQEFLMLKKPSVLYVIIAAVALFVGLLVYLLDRQPAHTYFLSHALTPAYAPYALFGVAGNYLPAFLHVYAFMLLTVAIAGSSNARLIRIGAAWFVIASLFEFGQHPAVSPLFTASLPTWFAHIPVLDNTAAYFLKGSFDLLDLLAIALGTATACITVLLTRNGEHLTSPDNALRRAFRYFSLSGITVVGLMSVIGSGGSGEGNFIPGSGDDSRLYISGNGSDALLVYDAANSVTGNTAASRTVVGTSTTLNAPRGIAVDMARNQVYIANTGDNSILVFSSASTMTGDIAPFHSISNIGDPISPIGLFIDPINDRLYVTSGNSVLVYDNVSGLNGTNIMPNRTLTGGSTELSTPTGIFVDTTRDLLYVANGDSQILVFNNASTVNGSSTGPIRTISIASSSAGVFVDVMADRLYVVNTGANSIHVFDNASTADGSPSHRVISVLLNLPRDIFVDTGTDRLYVANAGDDSILVFNDASTANNPLAPARVLSLPASTVPWGIYVDVTPLVIGSTASLDGFARSDGTASASGSPATGDKDASYSLSVGWRQLYSFDIANIPNNTTITAATLRLYQCDVQGSPYTSLGNVIVDQMNYGGVFDTFGSAYDGAAAALNIGTLSATPSLGYRSLSVTTQLQNDLTALRVRSQYRLRFSTQDFNFDGNDDFVQFTDAEDSLCVGVATNQPPQLAVILKP
jgi:DNA-binding beta-propeller fold protein YncE